MYYRVLQYSVLDLVLYLENTKVLGTRLQCFFKISKVLGTLLRDVEIDSCIYQHIYITSQCHPKQTCQILGQSSIFSAQEQYKINYKKSLTLEFYHLLDHRSLHHAILLGLQNFLSHENSYFDRIHEFYQRRAHRGIPLWSDH